MKPEKTISISNFVIGMSKKQLEDGRYFVYNAKTTEAVAVIDYHVANEDICVLRNNTVNRKDIMK